MSASKSLLACREGRAVDHLLTLMFGCSADGLGFVSGRRGHSFAPGFGAGFEQLFEIFEVYRDGTLAAFRMPQNPWSENTEFLLFKSDEIDYPCRKPCGLGACGASGAYCKRGRAR